MGLEGLCVRDSGLWRLGQVSPIVFHRSITYVLGRHGDHGLAASSRRGTDKKTCSTVYIYISIYASKSHTNIMLVVRGERCLLSLAWCRPGGCAGCRAAARLAECHAPVCFVRQCVAPSHG